MNTKEFTRSFSAARKTQGFRDQKHLDAFYRSFDHRANCGTCGQIAGETWMGDGQQPFEAECDEGRRLRLASE